MMEEKNEALHRLNERRSFIRKAAAGTVLTAFGGGLWVLSDQLVNEAMAAKLRPDGKPKLPPGQRVISSLKPMGGQRGNPSRSTYRLKLHGEVERPQELNFAELEGLNPVQKTLDVHCVTGWSAFDQGFTGVSVESLAKKVGIRPSVAHVIFEAAHGYTANVPLDIALREDVLLAWELNGDRLPREHGAPVRVVNPHLYFWKGPKWLTGIRFQTRDERGYWERRGYSNSADPWREERYA